MHRILPTLVLALAMAGVARAELPDPKIVLSPCNRPAVLEWEMRLLSGEQTRARFAPGFRGLCFHPRIQEPHRAWVAVRARCVPGTIEAPDRENATDWTAWTYRGDPDPALHVSSCPHLEVP